MSTVETSNSYNPAKPHSGNNIDTRTEEMGVYTSLSSNIVDQSTEKEEGNITYAHHPDDNSDSEAVVSETSHSEVSFFGVVSSFDSI